MIITTGHFCSAMIGIKTPNKPYIEWDVRMAKIATGATIWDCIAELSWEWENLEFNCQPDEEVVMACSETILEISSEI